MQGIEPFGKNLVELEECRPVIPCQESVRQRKRIFVVEHIQVLYHLPVPDSLSAERHSLIEYRQSIAHCPVSFHGYHMQGFVVYLHTLLLRYHFEVPHYPLH